MQRVRELLVQASNDTNTQAQRKMIEQEIQQLGEEVHGMQKRVEFNTNQVLNIGYHGTIRSNISEAESTFATAQATVASAAASFAGNMGGAQSTLAGAMSTIQSNFEGAMSTANTNFNNAMASASTEAGRNAAIATYDAAKTAAESAKKGSIAAADLAFATSANAIQAALDSARDTYTIAAHAFTGTVSTQFHTLSPDLDGVGVAWFQVGANSNQGIEFDFATVSQAVLVAGSLVKAVGDVLVTAGSLRDSGVGFGADITSLVNQVNAGVEAISTIRANLGAVQNRMDYTMRSLDISSENLSDSESRVRNADMAREMMRFTQTNVLAQAATAMLAQANQIPNNLLQLLR